MGIAFFRLWLIVILQYFLKGIDANDEGHALYVFKNATTHDPNNALQSWDPTLTNPCTWFHVTCDDRDSVIRIELGGAGLIGPLVPELGSLPNLQYLELYNNSISGKIPKELGDLTNLVSLDLYHNYLFGPIPETFGNLKQLRFLRLNNNNLLGNIPETLTSIETLKTLDLSYNLLEGNVPDSLCKKFKAKSFANHDPRYGPDPICPYN